MRPELPAAAPRTTQAPSVFASSPPPSSSNGDRRPGSDRRTDQSNGSPDADSRVALYRSADEKKEEEKKTEKPTEENRGRDRNPSRDSRTPNGSRTFKSLPLPAGIPGWFSDNDKDTDGQVGMYEWPKDKLDEFAKFDRNGDGLITIEEAMRFATKPVTTTVVASNPSSPTTPATTPAAGNNNPNSTSSDDERIRRSVQDMLLRPYDRNNDGKLDQEEIQRTQRLRYAWQQYDANKNNAMEMDEMVAYMKSAGGGGGGNYNRGNESPPDRAKRWLTEADANKDGRLSADELRQKRVSWDRAAEFDGNKDNGLDEKELIAYLEKNSGGGPGGPGGGNQTPEERAKDSLNRFDRNKDGKFAKDEFPFFYGANRFDEWDTNKDGSVDLAELTKGLENFRR